ncbi:MAG: CarD family transcriptional regulator [Planctomycetota bacterium]
MERIPRALARDPRLAAALRGSRDGRVTLAGLYGSARAVAIAALASLCDRALLVVTAYPEKVVGLAEDLRALRMRSEPIVIAAAEEGAADDPEVRGALADRVAALARARTAHGGDVVLLAAGSLLDEFPSPVDVSDHLVSLAQGQTIDRDAIVRELLAIGYLREAMVTAPGEIALRGDVIDIFPLTAERPTRIELDNDRIESIREVDPETQLSVRKLERLDVGRQSLEPSARAERGARALLEHFAAPPLLVVDELSACVGALEEAAFEDRALEGARKHSRDWLENSAGIALLKVHGGDDAILFQVEPPRGTSDLADLGATVARCTQQFKFVVLLCATPAEKKRLKNVLREQAAELLPKLQLHVSSLEEGFAFVDLSTIVLNHHELLSRRRTRRPTHLKARRGFAVKSVLELSPGDYVVHVVHGVARYLGPKREPRDGLMEDFLTLEFEGDTILYLPASKVDLIERYVGVGGVRPKLDKLGGRSWAKKKDQVNQAVDDLAAELLEVQAMRQEDKPYAHLADDEMQAQFEASFPFAETDDQLHALADIKQDLESSKPMDRLLCGDVGFGKTEVAIRAAFKAILSKKQVAVLVPTTLLAQQHYDTFRARFADYPVMVDVLSRFRSARDQKRIADATREGKIDVLIGTHRLLSKDVAFADLGLVVIDEEQRFGVRHKERLKRLRATVDVLTLTATPIPRTLHMALVGLRDISALRTAPKGRMAIQTEVHHRDEALIKNAVHRELKRGGQVFYVCHRVIGIERHADLIERLVPAARVGIAHGQMPQHELETAARDFADGKLDVLVCTTIIESGIDIPRVNTLIVDRADMFGLADLHQLRGRIGRSSTPRATRTSWCRASRCRTWRCAG